jgi:hypothetical protein
MKEIRYYKILLNLICSQALVISQLIHIGYVCMCKVSALVTGEFYTKKEHFPGFARPFVFNAEVMLRLVSKHFLLHLEREI